MGFTWASVDQSPLIALPSNLELVWGTTLDGNLQTNTCEIMNQIWKISTNRFNTLSPSQKTWPSKQKKTFKKKRKRKTP